MDEWVEPPRQELGFRVIVVRSGAVGYVDVTDAVVDMYDMVMASLDYGSGFLSTEELQNLHHFGVAIGAKILPKLES